MLSRRGFVTGILCAPAIVRVSSLMALSPLPLSPSPRDLLVEDFFKQLIPKIIQSQNYSKVMRDFILFGSGKVDMVELMKEIEQ